MGHPTNEALINFLINVDKFYVTEQNIDKTTIAWHRVKEEERNHYKQCVHNRLHNMYVPRDAIMCHNVICKNENHRQQLSRYCKELIQICVEEGHECFPTVLKKGTQVSYWNETVQPLKDDALFWKSIWVSCGKPRESVVAQIMRRTKHKYHYTIRAIKKREDDLRKSLMAESLIYERNHRNFWAEYKKLEGQSKQKPQINIIHFTIQFPLMRRNCVALKTRSKKNYCNIKIVNIL